MGTKCNLEAIKEKILSIFKKRFEWEGNTFSEDFCNEELLGKSIGLKARDLIYLYYDIENEFNIGIPEEEIVAGRFNTINNIADILYKQLLKKEGLEVAV